MKEHVCMTCKPPQRYPGCHAVCEKYQAEWNAAQQRYKENLQRKKVMDVRRSGLRDKHGINRKMYLGEGVRK